MIGLSDMQSTVNLLNPLSSTETSFIQRGTPLDAFLITQLPLIVPSGRDVALSIGALRVLFFAFFIGAFRVFAIPYYSMRKLKINLHVVFNGTIRQQQEYATEKWKDR